MLDSPGVPISDLSQEGQSSAQPVPQRKAHKSSRTILTREACYDANGGQRLERLAALLSEALSRRLGQVPPVAAESPAAPLDYLPVVSPTTVAKSAVPTEEM